MTKSMNSIFKVNFNADIRTILLKNALGGFLGRCRDEQLVLYTFTSRLVLLFQKPITIMIYDENNWEEPVFKSLNISKNSELGDPALANLFDKQFAILDINILKNSAFRFYNTKFHFVFFIVKYSNIGNIEDTKFEPVKVNDNEFGSILSEIFQNQQCNFLNIEKILNKPDYYFFLENRFEKELKKPLIN